MTSKQRSYLKGLAMNLEPVFQIGKASVTPEVTESVLECFNTKELIKGSILKNCTDDVKEVAAGYECGILFDKFNDIAEMDQVEIYIMQEVPRK